MQLRIFEHRCRRRGLGRYAALAILLLLLHLTEFLLNSLFSSKLSFGVLCRALGVTVIGTAVVPRSDRC